MRPRIVSFAAVALLFALALLCGSCEELETASPPQRGDVGTAESAVSEGQPAVDSLDTTHGAGSGPAAGPEPSAAKPAQGVQARLKLLEAERDIYRFPRWPLRKVPGSELRPGHCVIGWSGEDTLLLSTIPYDGEAKCYVVNLSKGGETLWQPDFHMPPTSVGELAFTEETSRRPVLLNWTDKPQTMVDWAVRFDLDEKKVLRLSADELDTLRQRVTRLLPPPDPEEVGEQQDQPPMVIVRGDGKILRKKVWPVGDSYVGCFSGRCVAEGHDPPLYLFCTRPAQLNVDALDGNLSNFAALVRTGGIWEDTADFFVLSRGNRTWFTHSRRELWDACISVDGSAVAFVLFTTSQTGEKSSSECPKGCLMYEEEEMDVHELRLISPFHTAALVDFTGSVHKKKSPTGWSPGGPLPSNVVEKVLAEPPDALRYLDQASIRSPSLSPNGTRLAYVINGILWVADISNSIGGASSPGTPND